MAPTSWVLHVETCVDPDRPAPQQAASQNALVDLLTHKNLSILQVVKDMGNFLTSTDTAVRARGMLLLGELCSQLAEQPWEDTTVHSFSEFFSSRLADWHGLRGTLVGSLALLKRGKSVGSVQEEDAKLFVQSALDHLEVQALAQQDRMLCLELLECLLDQHASAIASTGERFVEGVCAAIDGEKDPRCLLLAFHIVELVAELFPDPDGPLEGLAEDLFSFISCYFPISFNPPPGDTMGITREDLSTALMKCFASTKLFAPFCIPLLLEKLSSSLRTAKLDSLKYMGYCSLHYGANMFREHGEAIWMALKQELLSSPKPETISTGERDDEVVMGALDCFMFCVKASQGQMAVHIKNGDFLQLVLQDVFVDDFIECLPNNLMSTDFNDGSRTGVSDADSPPRDISITINRATVTVMETGHLLAAAAKPSISCCFYVLNTVFKRIFETLKVPVHIKAVDMLAFLQGDLFKHNLRCTGSLNVAVLEAILLIVVAAKTVAEEHLVSLQNSSACTADTQWMTPLRSSSTEVLMAFALVIVAGLQNVSVGGPFPIEKIWEVGVAGLQAVASFPAQVSVITEEQLQFIIYFLLGIVAGKPEVKLLWDRAVGALSDICTMDKKSSIYAHRSGLTDLITHSLSNEILKDNSSLPLPLNLKALAVVCCQRPVTSIVIVQKLTEIFCDNLKEACNTHDGRALEKSRSILQGLSQDVLPCCSSTESESEAMLQLALSLWNATKNLPASFMHPSYQILEESMGVLRIAIFKCNEQSQRHFLQKLLNSALCESSAASARYTSPKDHWMIGLFAAVVVGLHPSIYIFQEKVILPMLLTSAVCSPCVSVAKMASEAVASILNKWYVMSEAADEMKDNNSTFIATINMILRGEWLQKELCWKQGESYSEKQILCAEGESLKVKLRGIQLLACIGKGLAMRGHIAVSDIAMLMLRLVHCDDVLNTQGQDESLLNALWPKDEEVSAISFAAAEGVGFILKDSETSLNKNHHAIIKPLYKQRFFVSMLPPLGLAIKEAGMQGRVMVYRAFGNLVSSVPSMVLLTEVERVFSLLLESLCALCNEQRHSDVLLSVLLALSALLVDKNVRDIASQHVSTVVNRLLVLISYPFSTVVRETALLCLGAVVALPYARVFPVRTQVVRALTNALDDPKRMVRREAVRCRQAWDAVTR